MAEEKEKEKEKENTPSSPLPPPQMVSSVSVSAGDPDQYIIVAGFSIKDPCSNENILMLIRRSSVGEKLWETMCDLVDHPREVLPGTEDDDRTLDGDDYEQIYHIYRKAINEMPSTVCLRMTAHTPLHSENFRGILGIGF